MVGDFFVQKPYQIKITKKKTISTKELPQRTFSGDLNQSIEVKKNFFTNFSNQIDFFDKKIQCKFGF